MKNTKLLVVSIVLSLLTIVILIDINKNVSAEGEVEEAKPETIEDELNSLKQKLINIERSIAELSLDIHAVKENLSLYIVKEGLGFDVTFIEILLNDVSKYKHIYSSSDNENLEKSVSGKKVAKLFWASLNKGNARIKVRCFYRMIDDKTKKEYKLEKDFKVPSRKKVSNFLSITLKEVETNSNGENIHDIDADVKFW